MQARFSRKSAISIIAERTLRLLIKARAASHMMRTESWLSAHQPHDTLGIIPLAAGVVTTLLTSAKNSFRKLIDFTTYLFCCHNLTVIFLLELHATVQWSPGMRCSTKSGIFWHCSAPSVISALYLLVLWWRILCLIAFVLCLIWIEKKNQIFTASLLWSRNFYIEWQSTENAFPIKLVFQQRH